MSEPIGVTISLRLPNTWNVPTAHGQMPAIVQDFRYAVCNAYVDDTDNDDGTTTWRIEGEGNYGLHDDGIDNCLDWCMAHHIPFIAMDDAKYEWDGTIRIYDGTTEVSDTRNADGDVVLDRAGFHELRDATAGHDHGALYRAIDEHFERFNRSIEDLDISHLPIWPFPDPDDREEAP